MAKQKVVMTGGTGLVGSRIIELLSAEIEFVDASKETGVDLLDEEQLSSFFNQHPSEVVIHLAAATNVAAAQEEDSKLDGFTYRMNVGVTQQIARRCFDEGRHLVYVSTDYVFDGRPPVVEKFQIPNSNGEIYDSKDDGIEVSGEVRGLSDDSANPPLLPLAEGGGNHRRGYTEEDAARPINWYGYTKYVGEREVIASGVEYTIVRIASPFREFFEPKKDYIRKLIEGINHESLYPMFTDQVVTPTFIDDIAEGMRLLLSDLDSGKNEVFHVTGDESLCPYDIAVKVAQTMKSEVEIKRGSLKSLIADKPIYEKLYPMDLSMDNSYFKKTFGWQVTPLEVAMGRVVRAVR